MYSDAKYQIGKDIVLARKCRLCTGSKRNCSECDGIGMIVTHDGSQIIALVYDLLFKEKEYDNC